MRTLAHDSLTVFVSSSLTVSAKARFELERRALRINQQNFLPIDFYRIRKRLAVPLPLQIHDSLSELHNVRAFSSRYPWAIWLMWALEDRVLTLGEVAARSSEHPARDAVVSDVASLTPWRTYRQSARIDLPYAHAVRILCRAFDWSWVDDDLRMAIRHALARAVDDALPFSDALHASFDTPENVLSESDPHLHLHNIPVIGACALALAAKAVGHRALECLNKRVNSLFGAVLELRAKGFTEGVSYDGYVLDFIADWLASVDEPAKQQILEHPAFVGLVEQVITLAVPGDVVTSAPLGDVEPLEMPFVWSALAKLQAWLPNPVVSWALSLCDLSRLRADALAALMHLDEKIFEVAQEPTAGQPSATNYALVMRTGHSVDDVAVVMGLSHSPMGHIQCDNGSLVLGMRGRWWLDDPGYQQYLQTSERQFTIGATAHNAPVINGYAQVRKHPELLAAIRQEDAPDVQFAWVDLTACYPAEAQADRIRRAVWLIGREHLVVCDDLALANGHSLSYHWHGHADLFWCLQADGATLVSEEDADRWLHIFSPQISLNPADLHRLRGSRGQQTLSVTVYPPSVTCVWWVFSFAAERPSFSVVGRQLQIGERCLRIDDRLPASPSPWQRMCRHDPVRVSATRQSNTIIGRCEANLEYFQGELEYAFYLMIDGEKALVEWYTPKPEVCFTLPEGAGDRALEVRGFVREKANPDKKLVRGAVVPKVVDL